VVAARKSVSLISVLRFCRLGGRCGQLDLRGKGQIIKQLVVGQGEQSSGRRLAEQAAGSALTQEMEYDQPVLRAYPSIAPGGLLPPRVIFVKSPCMVRTGFTQLFFCLFSFFRIDVFMVDPFFNKD